MEGGAYALLFRFRFLGEGVDVCDVLVVVVVATLVSSLRLVDRDGDGEAPFEGERDGNKLVDNGALRRGLRRTDVLRSSEMLYMNWFSFRRPSKLGVSVKVGRVSSVPSSDIVT